MGCTHSRIRPTYNGKEPISCTTMKIESPHTKYEQKDRTTDLANHKTVSNGHSTQDIDNNNSTTGDNKSENGLKNNNPTNNKSESEMNSHIVYVNESTEKVNNKTQQNSQKNVKPKLQRNGSAFLEQPDSSEKLLLSKAQQQQQQRQQQQQQEQQQQQQQQQQEQQQQKQQTNKKAQKNISKNSHRETDESSKDTVALKSVLKPSGNSIQEDFVTANRPHKSVTFVESVMVLR